MSLTRVVLADDHPLFREGVARTLEESGAFTVVATGASGREALSLTIEHAPDLVLLDLSMPDGGQWALEKIKALETPPMVAMLTVSEDDDTILAALSAGASGYVLKGIGSRELVGISHLLALRYCTLLDNAI